MKMSFDRRAALRAFGLSAPALALASAAQSAPEATEENPELILLVARFEDCKAKYLAARAKFETAHRIFLSARQDVPAPLFLTAAESKFLARASIYDFNRSQIDHPTKGFWPILTAENIRREMKLWDGRSRVGKRLRRVLPLAAEYEAKVAMAVEHSQIDAVDGERNFKHYEFETAGSKLMDAPARTLEGLQLQAQAIASFYDIGHQDGFKAMHWALKFAQRFAATALPPLSAKA